MTTSTSSVTAARRALFAAMLRPEPAAEPPAPSGKRAHTFASRFIFLLISGAIVMTTLAYGTVHYWALAVFWLSAVAIICFAVADAWQLGSVQLSLNPLQLPVLGMIVLGMVQLLPLRAPQDMAGLPIAPSLALSFDPYATRLIIIQITSLLIYFAATLIFTDTPERLRLLARTIMIFGFALACFGMTQSFATGGTRVYWFRELAQSTAFGPFINRDRKSVV